MYIMQPAGFFAGCLRADRQVRLRSGGLQLKIYIFIPNSRIQIHTTSPSLSAWLTSAPVDSSLSTIVTR